MEQQRVFRNIVRPAVRQAQLTLFDETTEGVVVNDISPELIEQVHEADVVVADVSCYETSGAFSLSPLLCYFIALSHSLGNRTILVAHSTAHLPAHLQKHHTLTYSSENPVDFYDRFERVARGILAGEDNRPDNPIQEYRKEKDTAEEIAQAKAQAAEKEAQLKRLRQQMAEGKQPSPPKITFRQVSGPGKE
jgi:hypothetical protein